MSKPVIPVVPVSAAEHGRARFDATLKESIESLTGVRGGRLTELDSSASLDDVIAKVNEIIRRLQT